MASLLSLCPCGSLLFSVCVGNVFLNRISRYSGGREGSISLYFFAFQKVDANVNQQMRMLFAAAKTDGTLQRLAV